MFASCSQQLGEIIDQACSLSRKFELAKKGPAPLVSFIRGLHKLLEKLEIGGKMLIPGGISNGNMVKNYLFFFYVFWYLG